MSEAAPHVPFAETKGPESPERLHRGALGLIDIAASTMANIGPAYSFMFGFGLLVITAGIAAPLTIVAAIVAIALLGNTPSPFEPKNITNGFSGLAAGFPLAVYLFIGWENSAALAEETNNPRRNVPRAVFLSIGLMAVTYLLLAYSTVSGFNYNGKALAASEIPFITVTHDVAGWLAFFAYMAGMTSTLGVLIAAVNSQCRLIFNAGREGLLPRWIGKVNPVRWTPNNAIITFITIAG